MEGKSKGREKARFVWYWLCLIGHFLPEHVSCHHAIIMRKRYFHGAVLQNTVTLRVEKAFSLKGVQIFGNDLRIYHPLHEFLMKQDDRTAAFYTDRDSGLWVEKSIEEAKKRGVNIVIEGTMRNSDVVSRSMRDFRMVGYEIEAQVLLSSETGKHFSSQMCIMLRGKEFAEFNKRGNYGAS